MLTCVANNWFVKPFSLYCKLFAMSLHDRVAILVSPHSATNFTIIPGRRKSQQCTNAINAHSTSCLVGCSVGDCTKTSWTGISLCGVKVGNPPPVSTGNVTESDKYL